MTPSNSDHLGEHAPGVCLNALIRFFPTRLTFSASSSDDDRRITQRSTTHSHAQTTRLAASEKEMEGEKTVGTDSEHRSQTDTVEEDMFQNGTVASRIDGSFHPKKTSTQVKTGGAKSAVKRGSGRRVVKKSIRPLSSDSEDLVDGEEEEDCELMSLLQPSARVSRLMGLSQLTRSRKSWAGEKSDSRGRGRSDPHREGESTDEERLSDRNTRGHEGGGTTHRKSPPGKMVSKTKKRPAGRSTGNATILANTMGKQKKKSSRKSVAFNPHTTNLGSPDLPTTTPSLAEAAGTDGAGVYDNIPSDEEDFTNPKSLLYSPNRKYLLRRKFVGKKATASSTPGGQVVTAVHREERDEVTGSEEEEEEEDNDQKVSKESGQHRHVHSVGGTTTTRELSVQVRDITKEEQWFVPDQLDILRKVSTKSPLLLRRLTRLGQTSHVSDMSTASSVSPPRQKQRRRRKLDSTVQRSQHEEEKEDEEEEEEEEEEERGGVSRSDGEEDVRKSDSDGGGSSASSIRRRQVNRSPGKKKSRSNKRSSSKLTPPWRSKRGKRSSDGISERDRTEGKEKEKHTPVSKKQRLSTPEEDEGMQSGGGMSLSSSEEEDAMHLVQSMGGRRYRRHMVRHQDTKTPGVRRSKRARLAPVQFWRNEEPEYERRHSGMKESLTVYVYNYTMRNTS